MRRVLRSFTLATVLAVTAFVVPNGGVNPTDTSMVRVERAHGVDLSPDVIWILALGSDARPGQNVVRSRADAIQLVGINTRTGAATSIGIPRDSWVPIAGYGSNRINASLYFGGPQLMARSVANLTGIEPDYVFVTSFWGLRHMVDAIGGIVVHVPYAYSDENLRPQGFHKGRNRVNGMGALAFSRIRHNLLRGDFERSAHQQGTIRSIQAKIRANADRPGFIDRGVLAVMSNMDTNLSPSELFRIAQAVAQVNPSKITGCVVQGSIGNIGGASIVFPNTSAARAYGRDARKDAVLSHC
jgi:polyisoprenyl-teichoic acid--peptidoglycan teichoic acid transferase